MKIFLVIIIIYFTLNIHLCSSKVNFDVYGKSVKYWFDKEWGTITSDKYCRILTSREYPGGRFNCAGYLLKPVNYVYVQFQLFYRYGTIYRNYLLNYKKIEPCELMKKHRSIKYSNPLADLVLKGIKLCCPLFNHECPYLPGWYNSTSIDINGTIAPLLPPVVPVGQYKLYGRGYLEGNKTVAEIIAVGVVKANYENRLKDFSMLNMG